MLTNVNLENLTKPDLQKPNKTQHTTRQNLTYYPPAAISTYCLDASELLPCSGKRGKRWEAIPAGAKKRYLTPCAVHALQHFPHAEGGGRSLHPTKGRYLTPCAGFTRPPKRPKGHTMRLEATRRAAKHFTRQTTR